MYRAANKMAGLTVAVTDTNARSFDSPKCALSKRVLLSS